MNASQIKHLKSRLQDMLRKMIDAQHNADDSDYEDEAEQRIEDLKPAKAIELIKAGKLVLKPCADKDEYDFTHFRTSSFCYAKDVKKLQAKIDARNKREKIRDAANAELARIEDKLVFENAADAGAIMAGFEATLKRLTK